jgi:hypothetical protein
LCMMLWEDLTPVYDAQAVYHMPTSESDEPHSSIPMALQSSFYKVRTLQSSFCKVGLVGLCVCITHKKECVGTAT